PGRLGETLPRAARGANAVQGTAQRLPGTPSARREGSEQRQTAAPQTGREQRQTATPQTSREAARRRGNITPPNAPPRTPTQVPAGPREGRLDHRAGGRERQSLPAREPRLRERAPAAHTPSGNRRIVQPGPAARPPVNRQPAIARPPLANRPPAVAAR